MPKEGYVIGADFGTDSVRTVVFDAATGEEKGSHVAYYPRWKEGRYCDPSKNMFRQHPLDYIESLEESVRRALSGLTSEEREKVAGIGIDTTGSTPAPVDKDGTVLALKDEFRDNPNAMFVLWKDHTAVEEAERINEVAGSWEGTDFTKYEGGVYSSEWFWSKILHILREDSKVGKSAYSWVEHTDWVPALLTGTLGPHTMKRSRCAAGHKAMWHEEWGGLPPSEFLGRIDPLLKNLPERLYRDTFTADVKAGGLTAQWADRFGLQENTPVAVGAFDAHMGAVGAQIGEHTFVMILGTSACDMAVCSREVLGEKLVSGICGQVDGSIIPGMVGLEAGQSSFGDVYAWFRDMLLWMVEDGDMKDGREGGFSERVLARLTAEAQNADDETFPLALDWLNGRRTPYADQKLKGALIGLTLGTTAPKIFKALVESTGMGARAIVERFKEEGIEFKDVIASGGIPKKSPYVMQALSDCLGMPVKVSESEQAGALGAAMFAACIARIYRSVQEAQRCMGSGVLHTYRPSKKKAAYYTALYERYKRTGALLEEEFRV
ncbi:MAG TPA: ribulokinase [Spirochaetota bacterium]|nr:ribulokinase [Spirochaetota bacterium]